MLMVHDTYNIYIYIYIFLYMRICKPMCRVHLRILRISDRLYITY